MENKWKWGMNYLNFIEDEIFDDKVCFFYISDEEFSTNIFLNKRGIEMSDYFIKSDFKRCIIVNVETKKIKQFSQEGMIPLDEEQIPSVFKMHTKKHPELKNIMNL
jgi:hypothetical protein